MRTLTLHPGSLHLPGHRGRLAAKLCLLACVASGLPVAVAQTAAGTSRSASATSAAAVDADALASCERAVRQALLPAARTTAQVRFSSPPSVQPSLSGDGRLVLRGDGQWRDGSAERKFSYSCNLDPGSGEAVGVVLRQAAPPTGATTDARAIIEPDLSHLSPSACESSAATKLKQRWPRVSKISFDSDTRSLTQQSGSRAELRGQGRAQAAPESPVLTHFGFECTIDPRDGRVIDMRLSG